MRLTPTEEQVLIADSVRDFLAAEYGFARRRRSLDTPHGCEPEVWRQFAAMGWLGLAVPEHDGGLGAGLLEAGLLMRAFGRHLVLEPLLASALVATPLLARHGHAQQRARWLPGLLEGSRRAALAHEETAAPLPFSPRATHAARDGDGWRLRGSKQLVPGATGAELLLVTAQVGDQQRVFLLAPTAPGMQVTPARTADGAWAADIGLDGVRLAAADLLGDDADATAALRDACARQLVLLAWEASGAMAAALEQTATYVQQREQFGQPLAKFQAVAHRLAEMAVCSEEALAACELAALRIDAGAADAMAQAAMAKSKVGRAARFVADNAVQLHGAMGVTEELAVASWFRKLTQFGQQGGATAAHSRAFGTALLADAGWAESRTLGPLED